LRRTAASPASPPTPKTPTVWRHPRHWRSSCAWPSEAWQCISGDESEDETLLDEKDDEVEGGGGDTSACADDASAALLDTTTDQEGLILTGGDWFKTIKKAAENNVETEKELAERMKKAKISQMSQATLENEVFEGNPPSPRPADAGPSVLQKNAKKRQDSTAGTAPRPPLGSNENSSS
jgi:hypothetical protein